MEDLTQLQRRFVEEYMKDLNATQAAQRAGSKAKNLTVAGAEFLANPNVAAAIETLRSERSRQTGIDAAWVLKRLAEEAEADIADLYNEAGGLKPIHEWPLIWRQGLVSGVDIQQLRAEDGSTAGELVKIKLSDRVRRLEMIGKHVKVNAFQEIVQHKDLDGLADRLARAKRRVRSDEGEA